MKKLLFMFIILAVCCTKHNETENKNNSIKEKSINIDMHDVAKLFSSLPLQTEQVEEVFDAVSRSSENGYDEEYMIKDLLVEPGCGVGDKRTRAAGHTITRSKTYNKPLKDMLKEHLNKTITRSSNITVDEYLSALESTNYQIYWPHSEKWDKTQLPIITFNPMDGNKVNIGYEMYEINGEKKIREVTVTEEIAEQRPVWVINQNEDSFFESLTLKRKLDPSWGKIGGSINLLSHNVKDENITRNNHINALNTTESKALLLSKFKALRNYDTWFAGASEFFIKLAAIEKFTASTEAELKLYNPHIIDFMIVVKRKQINKEIPYNIVLISDWRPQLEHIAFMLIEDDGGSQARWDSEIGAKIKSKSYGINVSIPINTKDDIVWRGHLSKSYLNSHNGQMGRFGDVELAFEFKPNE